MGRGQLEVLVDNAWRTHVGRRLCECGISRGVWHGVVYYACRKSTRPCVKFSTLLTRSGLCYRMIHDISYVARSCGYSNL